LAHAVEIEKIDELVHPDIAGQYDYYYVPTFYGSGKAAQRCGGYPGAVKLSLIS